MSQLTQLWRKSVVLSFVLCAIDQSISALKLHSESRGFRGGSTSRQRSDQRTPGREETVGGDLSGPRDFCRADRRITFSSNSCLEDCAFGERMALQLFRGDAF